MCVCVCVFLCLRAQTYAVNVKTPVKHIYLDPAERAVTGTNV